MSLLREYIRSLLVEKAKLTYDELYVEKAKYWDEVDMMTLYMTDQDKAHSLNVKFVTDRGWTWDDYISAQEARLGDDEKNIKVRLDQMRSDL